MKSPVKRSNPDWTKDLMKRFNLAASKEIAVGFPKGKAEAYPDGTSLIQVAIDNCYGTSRIPKRDFMTLAQRGIQDSTKPIMAAIAKMVSKPQSSNIQAIENLSEAAGIAGRDQIKKAIVDLKEPPNAPSTIARKKGSDNPLIDTEHMHDSVTFVVRNRTRK